jgi:hypothetical protein
MTLNTRILGIAIGILCAFAMSRSAEAAARDELLGWGPFSFDMSRAQAKQAVGSKGIINDVGNMNYKTNIDGRPFDAGISFAGAGDRIQWIELKHEGVAVVSTDACHAEQRELQYALKSKFGDPDVEAVERDESILGSRSKLSTFRFKDGSLIQLYERWAVNSQARERCVISILYKPAEARAKENF